MMLSMERSNCCAVAASATTAKSRAIAIRFMPRIVIAARRREALHRRTDDHRQLELDRCRVDDCRDAHRIDDVTLGPAAFDHGRLMRADAHLAAVDLADGEAEK